MKSKEICFLPGRRGEGRNGGDGGGSRAAAADFVSVLVVNHSFPSFTSFSMTSWIHRGAGWKNYVRETYSGIQDSSSSSKLREYSRRYYRGGENESASLFPRLSFVLLHRNTIARYAILISARPPILPLIIQSDRREDIAKPFHDFSKNSGSGFSDGRSPFIRYPYVSGKIVTRGCNDKRNNSHRFWKRCCQYWIRSRIIDTNCAVQ